MNYSCHFLAAAVADNVFVWRGGKKDLNNEKMEILINLFAQEWKLFFFFLVNRASV